VVHVHESVENLALLTADWLTQHVTLGPPFLEGRQISRIRHAIARLRRRVRSRHPLWPAPTSIGRSRRVSGGSRISASHHRSRSSAYTAHLMDQRATRPLRGVLTCSRLAFGYAWRRADFPWMGIWEENTVAGAAVEQLHADTA
jgi:hypothetical protein